MRSSVSAPIASDHAGAADLAAMLAFASRTTADRLPLKSTWRPGDLIWALKDDLEASRDIRLWRLDGSVVAMAWWVAPGALWLEAAPAQEAMVGDILDWAEEALAANRPGLDRRRLSVRALGADARRIAALESAGYQRSAPESSHFRRDLSEPVRSSALPLGFRYLDCRSVDAEARAACHRDAWSHLQHLGIDARSTFSADTYRRLAAAPVYDPALDLMIAAPDGRLVCNTIAWPDLDSGVGIFEPVGTHVAFRGLGLARAITQEGCRRLRERGHRWAEVGTAHFNAPAIATYLGSGFERLDESAWWTRRLD